MRWLQTEHRSLPVRWLQTEHRSLPARALEAIAKSRLPLRPLGVDFCRPLSRVDFCRPLSRAVAERNTPSSSLAWPFLALLDYSRAAQQVIFEAVGVILGQCKIQIGLKMLPDEDRWAPIQTLEPFVGTNLAEMHSRPRGLAMAARLCLGLML